MRTSILQKTKRTILSIAALLFAATFTANAHPVDTKSARQAASTFLSNNGAKAVTLTDITDAAGFDHLYVFTTEKSFVVMPTDDCVEPILAYSLTHGFVTEGMPDNLRAWLQGYSERIELTLEQRQLASTETLQQWADLMAGNTKAGKAVTVVEPLLQTEWSQTSPYNSLCPSGSVTGCVATAMAQVMKYWNYPAHGIGWHSYTPTYHPEYGVQTADFNATTYDWSHMTNTYNNSSPSVNRQAVATLMYHCGIAVDMNYSPDASSASSSNVPNALTSYFNYAPEAQYLSRDEYTDSQWINLLKSELNQSRPVLYSGSGSGGGHAFVCDGYDNNNYFHFNWGWGGYCNDAYYSINNLNPGPGGTGSGENGVYNDLQGAVVGMHPSNCTATDPSNLTYTQDGNSLTLQWTAGSGASVYNIYRNGVIVGTATSNVYTETAPTGVSRYYVRSQDAQGNLSLSTNAITVTVGYQTPVVDDLSATVNGNNVTLTWTAPDWCYPETPTAMLAYGQGSPYYSWTSVYYGQRFLAATMAQYANKAVYKIETYIQYPGTYTAYIYTNSTSNNKPDASSLAATKVLDYSGGASWQEIVFDQPVILSGNTDLWVVMKQEGTGQSYPTPSCNLDSYNANACYQGSTPTGLNPASTSYQISWLIRTYITDGLYTYNIYRDGTCIANNVGNTSYEDEDLAIGTYSYYLNTNYYGGTTEASNQVEVEIGSAVVQTSTAFRSGWNWWSSYVEADDLLDQLEEGLGANGVQIKSQSKFVINYGTTWLGGLNTITNEQTYKVQANAPVTVELTGLPLSPADHPITLNTGWNWIGYPCNNSMSLTEAFSNYTPANGDQVKTQSSYAIYRTNIGWMGALQTLNPGNGLFFYSANGGTLVFPEGSRGETLLENQTADGNHWVPDLNAYPNNMAVMAVINLNDAELRSEQYELAAFANGEVRGSARLMYVEPLDRYMAFLTIMGDGAAELNFGLYDVTTNTECFESEDHLVFSSDAMIGTPEEPMKISFRGTTTKLSDLERSLRIYPNPVEHGSTINLNLSTDAPVRVDIVNALGVVVETLRATSVQAPALPGVYTLRITVDGKGTCCQKLIVK